MYWCSWRYLILYLGHNGEISKVVFNPQGTRILTGGTDNIGRLWDV